MKGRPLEGDPGLARSPHASPCSLDNEPPAQGRRPDAENVGDLVVRASMKGRPLRDGDRVGAKLIIGMRVPR